MTTNFQFSQPEEIAKAPEICQLKPISTRFGHPGTVSGKEAWATAFTPDYQYFAWSCGKGIVRLIPWLRDQNTYDPAALNSFIESSNCGSPPREDHHFPREHRIIEYVVNSNVWSLAFGSSVPQKRLTHSQVRYRHYEHLDGDNILLLAVGLQSGCIVLFNVFKKEKFSLISHKQVVRSLAFAPDGSLLLVSACRDNTLKVWDVKDDGNLVQTLKGHQGWVNGCNFSPDAQHMASVGVRGAVFIWDMNRYKLERKLIGHHHDGVDCQYSPDGALLITTSWDARAIAWDPTTGAILSQFHHIFPPMDPIFAGGSNDSFTRALSISPNGMHFATVCDDGYLRIWSLLDNSDPLAVATVDEPISCCFSPNGMIVAVGTRSGNVHFFAIPACQYSTPSLRHLSRMTIRKVVPNTNTLKNNIKAGGLNKYLAYQKMD